MSGPAWRRARWAALLGYAAVIFWLSSQTNPLPALAAHVWDKLLHLVEYGGFGAIFGLALGGGGAGERRGWRAILGGAAIAGLLYGASDEIHQSFVPGRDAEVGDVVADALGALAGGALSVAFSAWLGRRGRSPPREPARAS